MFQCDVLVVGGGPAGASMSISLARLNLKVIILEKPKRNQFKVGEGLIPAANQMIKTLGLSDDLSNGDHLPSYGNAWSWGSPELSHSDYLHTRQGHGWHLNRKKFDDLLLEKAEAKGAQIVEGYQFNELIQEDSFDWRIVLTKGDETVGIRSRFIADCSGRLSIVAKKMGVKRKKIDDLIALWVLFTPQNGKADLDATTLVEAEKDGWWHISLLPSGNKILTFFTDNNHPDIKQIKTSDHFLDKLSKTTYIKEKLKNYNWEGTIRIKGESAENSRLHRIAGKGWIAIGDAAMAFDPISSQGITNALYSAQEGAKAISAKLLENDIPLEKYVDTLEGIWNRYLLRVRDLYGAERRWEESFFWKNRLR